MTPGSFIQVRVGDAEDFALVSACDAHLVCGHVWRIAPGKSGRTRYASTRARAANGRSSLLMHRLILGLTKGDARQADHINGDGLDNRRENLRIATAAQNARNKRATHSKTGFKGVYIAQTKGKRRFFATIYVNGKHVNLGRFDKPDVAADAYDTAAMKFYGEFAATNKMLGLRP